MSWVFVIEYYQETTGRKKHPTHSNKKNKKKEDTGMGLRWPTLLDIAAALIVESHTTYRETRRQYSLAQIHFSVYSPPHPIVLVPSIHDL